MASTVSSGRVVEAAPEAAVCGALGCAERRPLYRVHHPSRGERVACETHARRLAESIGREAIPKGPKFNSSSSKNSGSTGGRHPTKGAEEGFGVKGHPEHGAASTMTASGSSPPEGQDGDGVPLEERLAFEHAQAIAEAARGAIPERCSEPTPEELLEETRRARAELALVEELLVDEVKEKAGGATSE